MASKLLLIAFAALAVSACAATRHGPNPTPTAASGDYFLAPVFQGDTLATFSARYGVPPDDIIAANSVRQRKSNKHILNGQLKVPAVARAREQRVAPAVPAAAQAAVQPAVLPAQPQAMAPPVAARRA